MIGVGAIRTRQTCKQATAIAVAVFFVLKLLLGITVLVIGARVLPVAQFAVYSQLMMLLAFFATIATAGVQHGLIRQVAVGLGDSMVGSPGVLPAALLIWGAAGLTLATVAAVFQAPISQILIGSNDVSSVVLPLAMLAVGSGLGALLCAVLTGEGRAAESLAAQGLGLIVATAGTIILLVQQRPLAAVMAFAAGPLLTTAIAAILTRQRFQAISSWPDRTLDTIWPMVRQLLAYSAAFLVTATIMPLTLLALRAIYRDTFGLELLGLWLAANRVSDVNTQVLGLYFAQDYLPKASRTPATRDRISLVRRSFFFATGAMLAGLAVFSLAPTFWVTLILSEKFAPAATIMWGYLAGDVLRVGASLLAFTALADRRLALYIGYEAGAAALLTIGVLASVFLNFPNGPAFAYIATYAIITLVGVVIWRRLLASISDPQR